MIDAFIVNQKCCAGGEGGRRGAKSEDVTFAWKAGDAKQSNSIWSQTRDVIWSAINRASNVELDLVFLCRPLSIPLVNYITYGSVLRMNVE